MPIVKLVSINNFDVSQQVAAEADGIVSARLRRQPVEPRPPEMQVSDMKQFHRQADGPVSALSFPSLPDQIPKVVRWLNIPALATLALAGNAARCG